MSSDAANLEARIDELERQLETVTEYCEDLEDRITTMAVAKVPEPRFPYWNWQLGRRMSTEQRRRMSFVLSTLDDRVQGLEMILQKDIPGVDHDVLYGDKPLQAGDATAAIKAVTGLRHDAQVIELLEAVQGQGMFRHLCPFLLAALRGAAATRATITHGWTAEVANDPSTGHEPHIDLCLHRQRHASILRASSGELVLRWVSDEHDVEVPANWLASVLRRAAADLAGEEE